MGDTFITDEQPIISAATEAEVESTAEATAELMPQEAEPVVIPEPPVLTEVVQAQAVHVQELRSFARKSASQPMVITQVTGAQS